MTRYELSEAFKEECREALQRLPNLPGHELEAIRFLTQSKATESKMSLEEALRWAGAAREVLDVLRGTDPERARLGEMNLRAALIVRHGTGPEVRDPQALAAMFCEDLPMSLEQARAALPWAEQALETIKALRAIKNRLAPLALTLPQIANVDPQVLEWLSLREALP